MTAAAVTSAKKKKKRRLNLKRFLPALALVLAAITVLGYYANRHLEKKTYQLAYKAEIRVSAAEFMLDPYLVAAIIHTESRGDPEAVSHKGAVGLMQIMPATGAWIAEKLAVADYTEATLTSAPDNIRLGCWYLSYLLEKYGDADNAIAAYNAGPGNVDKWLLDEKYSEDGALTNIPFEETKNYLARVKAAYAKYTELYEDEFAK